MARYLDEAQAVADGYRIVHEADRQRFALYAPTADAPTAGAPEASDSPEVLVGEAHYSLLGADDGDGVIDFDHTVVSPALRGTGLGNVLAHRAVTSDVIGGRRMHASCWFIARYLAKHPEFQR